MMLLLQQLFNLSDEGLEFQVSGRRSFEDFIGLCVMNSIPDATTFAFSAGLSFGRLYFAIVL